MEVNYNAGDIIEYKNRRYLITKVTTVYYTIRLDDGQTKHFQIYEQEDFKRYNSIDIKFVLRVLNNFNEYIK